MFFSSRHIQEMRDSLLAITSGEWFFLSVGLILGAGLWLVINRKVVRKALAALEERGVRRNPATVCESVAGLTILALNGGLLYLATQLPSYFLFSFAVTGLLVGSWIAIPSD